MTLDLGDEALSDSTITVTVSANTDFSAGDAVKWDPANDRVEQTDSTGQDIFGVAAEDAPGTAGNPAAIHIHGPVVASAGGSVVQGDIVVSTGSTAGQLIQNTDATGKSTDVDGTTDQGVFAPANPEALTDSGGSWPPQEGNSLGTNEAVVMLH